MTAITDVATGHGISNSEAKSRICCISNLLHRIRRCYSRKDKTDLLVFDAIVLRIFHLDKIGFANGPLCNGVGVSGARAIPQGLDR